MNVEGVDNHDGRYFTVGEVVDKFLIRSDLDFIVSISLLLSLVHILFFHI
jgi:hypothetical protein